MLYQDDIVSCKMEHGEIIAKVCGRALPHATLGDMYIIEPKESIYEPKDSIYCEKYPYTHFVMPECGLRRKHLYKY